MRVSARKGVASLRKSLYSTTHRRRNRPRQRPPDDAESQKGKKARTGTAILFFKKKTRRRRNVKARYFKKKTPRERLIKKRTCTAAKYEKTSKILCQNCVASLFLLRFLTFCVVRDHEAMGSNPVTPTRKKTNSQGLVFFQRCVPLHGT